MYMSIRKYGNMFIGVKEYAFENVKPLNAVLPASISGEGFVIFFPGP